MIKIRILVLAAVLCLSALAANAAPCTTAQTTCTTDTLAAAPIVSAITDTITGVRIYNHWNQACDSVYAEAATTVGHFLPNGTGREPMCLGISAGHVPNSTLVALIMNPLLQSEIQGCTIQGQAAGCLVDVDIDSAIAAAMVVTANTASTTGSTFAASTTATAALGTPVLTVASGAGIIQGMTVSAAGVPATATVLNVSGTTVTLSAPTTAALSTTPIYFYQTGVNSFSVASATGLSVGQSVSGPGVSPNTTVSNISGTTVTISNPLLAPLSATPLFFYLYTGLPTRSW